MGKVILFYITLFLLILIFTTNAFAFDYDLWARLIAGMGFFETGHVLTQDFLSFTPVHTWWDHEWGAGVIFYFFLKHFGGYSLLILNGILLFAIFATASLVVKLRNNEQSPYNIMFYVIALWSVMDNLNNPVRCHLFTFLFFTLFIYIFEKSRKGDNKLLYLTPLIIILWNNIHGGVVSGIGLMLIYALGEFLNKKPFKQYLITFLVSSIVLIINPWGIDYIKFLIMANTMPRPDVIEWWGIFSNHFLIRLIPFKIFMFGLLATEGYLIVNKIKNSTSGWYNDIDKTKLILILCTTYLSVVHVKLLPLFSIVAVCFMYEDFYKAISNIKMPAWKDKLIYSLIIIFAVINFATKNFSIPVGYSRFPVKEVEFVRLNNISGNLLTTFGHGSFVSYKLYPYNKIYMDGRYEEVYPKYVMNILRKFEMNDKDWNLIFKMFPIDVVIMPKDFPVSRNLLKSKDWTLAFEGTHFKVFVPVAKAKKVYIQPTDDDDYYKNSLFTTNIKF